MTRRWLLAATLASAALGALEGAWFGLTTAATAPRALAVTVACAALAQALLGLAVAAVLALGTRGRCADRVGGGTLALALWAAVEALYPLSRVDWGAPLELPLAALVGVGVALLLRPLARHVPAAFATLASGAVLLAAAVLVGVRLLPAKHAQGPASVLLVTVDTLRADRLGCYGWERARTETIDALAAEGILFEDAQAPSAVTCPSHVSILTGRDPFEHGAVSNLGTPLRADVASLADLLGETHATAGFVSGLPLRDEIAGLAGRFDVYDQEFDARAPLPAAAREVALLRVPLRLLRGTPRELHERRAADAVDAALAWLDGRDEPFFCWVHLYDPHIPYAPPPPYDGLFKEGAASAIDGRWYALSEREQRRILETPEDVARMLALYDGEVAYVDDQLERLFGALRSAGRWEDTIVVLTSDHGETHGEHASWFSRDLHQACLHVPLIVRRPDVHARGSRVREQVRLIDVAPTILEELDLPVTSGSGRSLQSLIDRLRADPPRPAFALAVYPPSARRPESAFALRHLGHKLLWRSARLVDGAEVPAVELLYDVRRDADELHDVIHLDPPILAELRPELEAWRAQATPEAEELDAATREALEDLGYAGGGD